MSFDFISYRHIAGQRLMAVEGIHSHHVYERVPALRAVIKHGVVANFVAFERMPFSEGCQIQRSSLQLDSAEGIGRGIVEAGVCRYDSIAELLVESISGICKNVIFSGAFK